MKSCKTKINWFWVGKFFKVIYCEKEKKKKVKRGENIIFDWNGKDNGVLTQMVM